MTQILSFFIGGFAIGFCVATIIFTQKEPFKTIAKLKKQITQYRKLIDSMFYHSKHEGEI